MKDSKTIKLRNPCGLTCQLDGSRFWFSTKKRPQNPVKIQYNGNYRYWIFWSGQRLENMAKRWVLILGFGQPGKWEKEKIFWTRDMVKRTGEVIRVPASYSGRPGFSQQDFSTDSAAGHLITHMSSESRSVDLTNNGMVNHYLRDVDHGSHCLARHRTSCFTYMSDYTSEVDLRGYMSDCLILTERQRIRTAAKFAGRSADRSEEQFVRLLPGQSSSSCSNHHTVL
jgi:hypothetical protein